MSDLLFLTPANCRITRTPEGILRAEIAERSCCRQAGFRRLFPIRKPDHFIAVTDGKDEVGIIEDLAGFDAATRSLIKEELDLYYAVPEILEIALLEEEYGYYHWKTKTDRGPRDFYIKGRSENVKFNDCGRLFITDVHNARYQIGDISRLPRASRCLLDKVY